MYKLNLVYDPKLWEDAEDKSKLYRGSLFSEVTDAPTWGILLQMLEMALTEARATIREQKAEFNKVQPNIKKGETKDGNDTAIKTESEA